jgi:hypothetical protein
MVRAESVPGSTVTAVRAAQIDCMHPEIIGRGPENRISDGNTGALTMKRTGSFLSAASLVCALLASGCATTTSPIPPAGTRVSSTSLVLVFRQTDLDLQGLCAQIGGCTCILDGIQTTCAVVFACLDAGFCERVRQD